MILPIKIILIIFSALLMFYMVLPFFTVVATLLAREKAVIGHSRRKLDFACIITAYQNIEIAVPLVESLLKQSHYNYLIYLVADGCDVSDLKYPNSNVVLLKPENKLSSKVKSIIHAVSNFQRNHDAVVIFDPDNLAKSDFLSTLNDYMNAGFKAVQGQRTAKNLETIYACADATGEIYKNYIERYAPYLMGSSPTIAGSGMAVETALFKEYLNDKAITASLNSNKVIAAEDKILQNFLVGKGYQIAFAKDAIVYDEKISTGSQVERQRGRWLFSYFENFSNTISFISRGIRSLNGNQFLFGLITSSPPMFLMLAGSLAASVLLIFFSKPLFVCMAVSIQIFLGNIFLVLFLSHAPAIIWKSAWSLPLFVLRQFLALFKMHQSRKDFMHTQHRNAWTLDQVEKSV